MVYMGVFLYLEIVEPKEVFLISCGVDQWIPCLPGFVYIFELVSLYFGVCVAGDQKSWQGEISGSCICVDGGYECLFADLLCVADGTGS